MNLLTSGYMFGAGRGGFIGFDWTYVLAILGFILTLAAQGMVSSTFKKYSVRTVSGLSGAEGAQRVLEAFGIGNVGIEGVSGQLTDHYDPQSKTLRLAEATSAGRESVSMPEQAKFGATRRISFIWVILPRSVRRK